MAGMTGSNNFADPREIAEATTRCDINGAIKAASARPTNIGRARKAAAELCPVGGIIVAANPDGTFQVVNGDYHSMTIAATRAGKTRRVIVPMFQSLILADRSNFIVNDPKGELIRETRDLLELLGFEIVCIDFRRPQESPSCYNPLSVVWDLWHMGEKDRAVDMLQDFAMVLNNDMAENTKDAYWPLASMNYFVGLALLLLEAGASREEFNMSCISMADADVTEGSRSTLKSLCTLHRHERSYEFLSEMAHAANDTAMSIKAVFRSSIAKFIGRGDLGDMMSETSCPAESFLSKRVALFIHTPDESASLSSLVVAMVNQLMSSLITLSRTLPEGRLPRDLEVILDEFGNLRQRLPDFDMMLAASCGHGIHLHFVMQSFSQFDLVYGPAMRSVALDNIEQWVYLGSRSLETNAYFSRMIGDTRRPPNYQPEPIMDVATLQRLERRRDESEAVMLVGNLKPFVAALPDLSLFERPVKVQRKKAASEKPKRKIFDLKAYNESRNQEKIDRLLGIRPNPW